MFFPPFFSHNELSFLFYFQTSRKGPRRLLFTISDYSIKGVNKWTNCHMIITIRNKNNHGLRLSWPQLGRRKAAPSRIAQWSYTQEDAYLPSNEEKKKKKKSSFSLSEQQSFSSVTCHCSAHTMMKWLLESEARLPVHGLVALLQERGYKGGSWGKGASLASAHLLRWLPRFTSPQTSTAAAAGCRDCAAVRSR